MRPRKLIMYNIGPFTGRTEIDFTRLDDIFLISGKTGSGKTTIFDALCFALYGKLPGSRKNLETKIRSDFAGLDEDCWVELEFSLGNETYLVQRSPKLERPKKRGTGTTVEEEAAVLYRLASGGERQSLSSRKSEADEKIARLLGLSADEFAKIILLPQGEFAQFLQQNSQARREVLRKLFPVEEAVAIRELAAEKKKEAEAMLKTANLALQEASQRYNEQENQAEQNRIRSELEQIAEKDRQTLDHIKTLSEALSRARQRQELVQRLAAIDEERRTLTEQQQEIEALSRALAMNQQAKPAQEKLYQERELESRIKNLQAEREQAEQRAAMAIHQYDEIENQKSSIENLNRECTALREQKGALSQAVEEEQRLRQLETRREELLTAIHEAEESLPGLRADIENLQELLIKSEGAAQVETTLQEQKEMSVALMAHLRNLLQYAQQGSQKRTEQRSAEERLAQHRMELDTIEKRLPILSEELADLEKQYKEQEEANLAARLAATLKQGEPCPVCGSLHHPAPALAPPIRFGTEEKISALKIEQKDLEKRMAELRTEIRNQELTLNRLIRELEEIEEKYHEIRTSLLALLSPHSGLPFEITCLNNARGLPEVSEVQIDIRNNSAAAETINKNLQQLRKESLNLAQVARNLQEKQGLAARAQAQLESGRQQIADLSHQIDEIKARLQLYFDIWKTETIALALNRLQQHLKTMEAQIAEYEKKKQQLGIEKAQALQHREILEKRWQDFKEEEAQLKQALTAMAEELGFTDTESLKAAILSPEAEGAYSSRVQAWKESMDRLIHQEEEARRALAGLHIEGPGNQREATVEALEQALHDTEEAHEQLAETQQALQVRLQSLIQDQERYTAALNQYNHLNEIYTRYKALSEDLAGSNPKKWPFDSWLLSLYLQEVTSYANRRLERMSEGRYSILLNPENENNRALGGLDLAVFDSFTGKTRPCATLSGGESFMASISLALGLADSIQARSGAVRLDAIFIDEGFGSLDEVSLDRALTILDEIRDHRMVGLISHVAEMKSRIPSKIEVIKSNQGSRILISGES
ncbi:MAG: AAA family ATPase [Treponema sp.]|nr:AAA family ATPase [Treponema sp.]